MTSTIPEILIASGNKGKLVEIATLLENIGIKVISPTNFNLPEPEETGKTFVENSVLKAKYYGDAIGFVALADDSGLCIDALSGEPGIHSARWAIDKKTGEKNFDLAFEKIKQALLAKNINPATQQVKAHFICNLTLYFPKTREIKSFEGRIDGILAFPPRGDRGFGYDPIFIANGCDKTFGEISPGQKDAVSHRAKAFEKLILWLKNNKL